MKKPAKDLIEATANAIMEHFIPKNEKEKEFSFHFTIPPSSNYRASYAMDHKGNWILTGCEIDEARTD